MIFCSRFGGIYIRGCYTRCVHMSRSVVVLITEDYSQDLDDKKYGAI